MTDRDDDLLRAYARLKALVDELPKDPVDEAIVTDFHDIVKSLENPDVDLTEFRIPESFWSNGFSAGGQRERFVDYGKFMVKAGALLKCFELKNAKPEISIGFRQPGP